MNTPRDLISHGNLLRATEIAGSSVNTESRLRVRRPRFNSRQG